jgi:hypothetical protein
LIAAALVVGCDRNTPTEQPTEAIAAPAFSADQNWVSGSFYQDSYGYARCPGEVMHWYGEVQWRYHQVTSNSGTYSYHFQLLNWAQNPPFYGEGTVSGKLFQFKGGPLNESFVAGPGEVYRWVSIEKYVADNGDWFRCQSSYHITVNANGDLSIEKGDPVDCKCKIND